MTGWVLVKGMKQDQRHWLGFDRMFADKLGTEVLCLDLPGAGTESHRLPPASVDGMADDLRTRWLNKTGGKGDWGIMGLSLGGMAALSWASRYPTDFGRVVVGNTSTKDAGGPHERLQWRRWPHVVRSLTMRDDTAREELVLSMVTSLEGARRREMAAVYARFQAERPFRRRAFVRQLLAGRGFRTPAPLSVPVLVLNGRGDRFVHPRCSERLAGQLQATLIRHPTAGHDLSVEAPDWIIDTVRTWSATA